MLGCSGRSLSLPQLTSPMGGIWELQGLKALGAEGKRVVS